MKKNSKKEKINPIIKGQTNVKRIKYNNQVDNDEFVIKKLIIISVIIAFIIGVVYITTELLKKEDNDIENPVVAGQINYDKISVGTLLNRAYDEYYVLIYNAEDKDAVLYSTILTKYMQKEDSKKIYFCDLNNKLNNEYYNVNNDNKSNPDVTEIKDFDFGDLTLIQVKKGKIVKYIEELEKIKEILK